MSAARALYVATSHQPVFGVLHAPEPAAAMDTAVLMCAPFGWDEVASHRSRRAWAEALAAAGLRTLRFDLPGTGDSAGAPQDPGLVDRWRDATAACARWLRALPGVERVAVIGFGVGGLLAVDAASGGAPIDDLVLWGVPARGRALVRELRAFASMIDSGLPPDSPEEAEAAAAAIPEGALAVNGFLVAAETLEHVGDIDLTQASLDGSGRRAMLLERSGVSVDQRLEALLRASGCDLEVAEGPSYNAIMDHPQLPRPEIPEFESVGEWIRLAANPQPPPAATVTEETSMELIVDGATIRERPLAIQDAEGQLAAVLAEPATEPQAEVGAVFLNAGAVRRIGPSRMWVEIGRRWAARGIPSIRLDLHGLGDSDGDADRFEDTGVLYSEAMNEEALAALKGLAGERFPERLILVGLCSGSYWALHAALRDERVVGAFMLNLRAVIWDPEIDKLRAARQATRSLVRNTTSLRLIRERFSVGRLLEVLGAMLRGLRTLPGEIAERRRRLCDVDDAFRRLRAKGTSLLFLFSRDEDLYLELEQADRWAKLEGAPNVSVETVPGRDHDLRPLVSQQRAHALLDSALDRYEARRS